MPKAVSPSRCRMKGDRKTPTRILTPRLNQLEPTFLKISARRIVSGPARPLREEAGHGQVQRTPSATGTVTSYPRRFIRSPHAASICCAHAGGKDVFHPPDLATRTKGMSRRRFLVATH